MGEPSLGEKSGVWLWIPTGVCLYKSSFICSIGFYATLNKNEIDLNVPCQIALSFVTKWEKSVSEKFMSYNPTAVKKYIHIHISYKNFYVWK